MFKYFCMLILLCTLMTGCQKDESKILSKTTNAREVVIEEVKENIEVEIVQYPLEKTLFGTVCMTNINDNNVNLRILPSLDAEIISQLQKDDVVTIIGFSDEKSWVDNFNGNWLNIEFKNDKGEYIKGWVFSKYVNISNKEFTPIKFVENIPAKNGYASLIQLSYKLEEKEIFAEINYNEWKNYYVILWDQYQYGFHYTNKPGIYLLNKNNNELKHITYLGTSEELGHAWTVFTDDYEYIIQDSGTGPGVRGITAWRLKDQKEIFQGLYYGMEIYDHTIEVVYSCDDYWALDHGYTDEEIVAYGKKYEKENPVPQDIEDTKLATGLGVELIIRCSINMDTGERKILGGRYILVQ